MENKTEMNFVEINKVELEDGEELLTFISKVSKAVRARGVNTDTPLCVRGIFKSDVVFQDFGTGKIFKSSLSRGADGDIEIGKSQEEVKQAFVPVPKNEPRVKCVKCDYTAKEVTEKECPECKSEIAKFTIQKSEDDESKFIVLEKAEEKKESVFKGLF